MVNDNMVAVKWRTPGNHHISVNGHEYFFQNKMSISLAFVEEGDVQALYRARRG